MYELGQVSPGHRGGTENGTKKNMMASKEAQDSGMIKMCKHRGGTEEREKFTGTEEAQESATVEM